MNNFETAFLWAVGILFAIVLILLPSIAVSKSRGRSNGKIDLNGLGLGLPKGSVRSMLALLIVGAFMAIAALGAGYRGTDDLKYFVEALSALAGVAGAVVGFYFGSRGSQPDPQNGGAPKPPVTPQKPRSTGEQGKGSKPNQ